MAEAKEPTFRNSEVVVDSRAVLPTPSDGLLLNAQTYFGEGFNLFGDFVLAKCPRTRNKPADLLASVNLMVVPRAASKANAFDFNAQDFLGD